jgi:tetratricopeptide (TPR) repeat protein
VTGLVRLAALTGCALVAAAPAADPPDRADPTPEQLVRDLGSPLFSVRDRASRELWKLGEQARPALTAALDSPDAEVARRAREILDKFDAGVLPDTPADVLKQMREFRSHDPQKQRAAVAALLKLGDPAVPALRALLTRDLADAAPENRGQLFDYLARVLRREVPGLLLDGRADRAEALLALNALGPSDAGLIDYAVFLHLRGRTGPAAADLERVKKGGGPAGEAAAKALVFVYRAAGDGAKAKSAARELDAAGRLGAADGRPWQPSNLYESLLEDLGEWGELADRPIVRANSPDGLKMFRLRLAGRAKEADEVADLQKDADLGDPTGSDWLDPATIALMLNHRPLDGIERMKARRNAPHILADVLAARLQFREALELVSAPEKDGPSWSAPLRQLYGTRRGRLLAQLGQRDAAAQVFGQLAEQITSDDLYTLSQLIRAEVRGGRYDLACEHLGRVLAAGERGGHGRRTFVNQDPFEPIFDADTEAAQFWWQALRRAGPAGEAPGATMRRVRDLLTGRADADQLAAAVKAAGRQDGDDQAAAQALAVAYRAHGKTDEAVAVLVAAAEKLAAREPAADEDPMSARLSPAGARGWVYGLDERFRFWVELGDLLAELDRHREAADWLMRGWRIHPDNPVLLYLSGRALARAGDEKEGRRRVELAHWVALGNTRLRGRFLEELISRGAVADARRERNLVREAGWVSETYIGNVWNQVARASVVLKDFDTAAAANHRAIHYLLRNPGVSYVEGYAYLTVPLAVRGYAARGLLAAGKADEAVAVARECLAVMPGHGDLVIALVPELDRLGRKADADELFRRVWDAYAAVLRDHPDSGWARYSAAWLAAGCRRELDAALAHAKKAVELDPELRSHKEALAEVHFRRGEREQAVALMKDLSAADRRNHHYKRQLERYQTGDITSPLPDGDDD